MVAGSIPAGRRFFLWAFLKRGRGAGVVEQAALEKRYPRKRVVGSNPTPAVSDFTRIKNIEDGSF